ncbi:MAG TPA: CDP-alcohol phosphatidyltransferase family protein [Candidatus Nanoarchaeia archaeon]|nr:CDP-alcohol phosphatidyltransferase family protein [Candidatus Nanoarchaeia archaeon]
MDKYIWNIINQFKELRTARLSRIASYLISTGITAHHLTLLSLLCGILAAYFFLANWWLLALFGVLHLIFDGLDGVVARLATETTAGKYFDLAADSITAILILIKMGWNFNDYFSYVVAGLYTLSLLFYFMARLTTVFIPVRTLILLSAIISTLPLFDSPSLFVITAAYLITGICSLYALARQLQLALPKWLTNK